MEEYSEEVRGFSRRLSRLLSENLNLPPELMEEAYGSFPSQVVRLNYYPPCPQPELVMGLSSHSDPGAITILLQVSDVCGLQVRKDGDWVSVHPEPNALIVNIGDQMEVPKIITSPLKLYRSQHCTLLQTKIAESYFLQLFDDESPRCVITILCSFVSSFPFISRISLLNMNADHSQVASSY